MSTLWDPALYLQFQENRTRPAYDLVKRIAVPHPQTIVDLGCGPGNSTAVVVERWPNAVVEGVDHSPAMIAAARETAPPITWHLGDLATWGDGRTWDIVFSNAALQWVPDHPRLLPRLFGLVNARGALAVQIPTHLQSALHRHILELAAEPPWASHLVAAAHAIMVQPAEFYYDLLSPYTKHIDLWETEYFHILPSPEHILAWIKGTGLRPFLEALPNDEQCAEFEARLLTRITQSYPVRSSGQVLFPFRRLFLIAYR